VRYNGVTLRQQHRCDAVHVLPPYPLVALGIILDHSMLKIRVGFRLQVVKKTPIYSAFADFQFLLCCVITVHQRCRRSYGRDMLYYTAAGRAENQRLLSLSRGVGMSRPGLCIIITRAYSVACVA